MMKKKAGLLFSMFAGSGLLLASISGAQAAAVLTLEDTIFGSGPQVVVADNTAAGVNLGGGLVTTNADTDPLTGQVQFAGVVGTFLTVLNLGTSTSTIGTQPAISLHTIDVDGGVGGDFIAAFSDTDFTSTAAATQLAISGNAVDTVAVEGRIDGGNALFGGLAGSAGVLGPFGPGVFADNIGTAVAVAGPYSLSLFVTVETPGFSTAATNFSANLKAVPIPGALVLFGSAFIGLVGLGRLKLGNNAERRR